MSVKIGCVALTHNGLVRPNNEDSILCNGWMRSRAMDGPLGFSFTPEAPGPRIFAVADGLGGHLSGNVASQFVLSRLCTAVNDLTSVSEGALTKVIQDAHRALFDFSGADPSYRGMGTTLAGLVIEPKGPLYLFHVGDSRIYRREDRFLQLLTKDDRLGAEAYGESDKDTHANPSLLQCLGGMNEFSQIAPHVVRIEMSGIPETFLLCTDGVSDMLSQDEMEEAMSGSLEDTVRTLFDRVRNAGAKDNISIMIVEISPGPPLKKTPVVPHTAPGLAGGQT